MQWKEPGHLEYALIGTVGPRLLLYFFLLSGGSELNRTSLLQVPTVGGLCYHRLKATGSRLKPKIGAKVHFFNLIKLRLGVILTRRCCLIAFFFLFRVSEV